MDYEFGSVLGAAAVIAIPLIAWLSPRVTHRGRLLGRISRLSIAYQAMPESHEREQLGVHITSAGAELLEWIDSDTRAHRVLRHWINAAIFGLVISIAAVLSVAFHPDPTVAVITNLVLGLAAGSLMVLASELLDRRATRRRMAANEAKAGAAQEAREQAFRRGDWM